jgi:anti-sigma-K factor RskA
MEPTAVHELTAAYALDALDEHEEREYEAHLRGCPQCREDLVSLRETAATLAYAVPSAAPPAGLRERVLQQARQQRANVVPLRPRVSPRLLGGLAAVAASVAVGLGIWAASLSRSLDDKQDALSRQSQLVGILSDPGAQRVSLSGANGRLVISSTRNAALVLSQLRPAPEDKTYVVWVITAGKPRPAGLFRAAGRRAIVRLTLTVPKGATVAVTVEPEGRVDQPTTKPLFSATA